MSTRFRASKGVPSNKDEEKKADRDFRKAGKWPIIRFLAVFAAILGTFYLSAAIPVLNAGLFPAFMRSSASASAFLLRLVGTEARAKECEITSSKLTVRIVHGCEGIEPMAIFAAGVLATPLAFTARAVGVVVGLSLMVAINLLRLVTVFLAGCRWPMSFERVHQDLWQPLFVFCAIVLWYAWAIWASRRAKGQVRAHG